MEPERLRIVDGSHELVLEPRVMELLVYLAVRRGEVVSTEQMLIDIWRGTFYGDGPVQRAMAILRRSLGDPVRTPRYIETIRKRGYRFIADVVLPENYPMSVERSGAAWVNGSPFVGLNSFDATHSSVFFGRARSIARLLDALGRQLRNGNRFVLVIGPSGCGKTSLLRAGVLPLLTRENGFDGMRVASMAWVDFGNAQQGDALAILAGGLSNWSLGERPVFADRDSVYECLHLSAQEMTDRMNSDIESAFSRCPPRSVNHETLLLLLIDHTEAVLDSDGQASSDCAALDCAIGVLCICPRVLVVMIGRSDFYPGLLAQVPAVATLKIPDGHFDLLPPSAGELAEIIRRPAQAAGLVFEKQTDGLLGLDDVLRDAAVAHPEALPMLQYTLQALYEARSGHLLCFEAYQRLGGLGGALVQRAEQLLAELPAEAQAALSTVLERLVISHESNQALITRRLSWAVLTCRFERELVSRLVDARLFTSSLGDGTPYFSVAHETLLRAWPRVQEWAKDNQRRLQAQQRVRQATQRWVHAQRRSDLLLNAGLPLAEANQLREQAPRLLDADDHALIRASEAAAQRRRRRSLLALSGALLLAVVSVLFAGLAVSAHQDAERRRSQAEALVDYLLIDLAGELRPLGQLSLLNHIAHRSLDFLSVLPESDVDQAIRLQRVRALRTLGEVFVERGENRNARLSFEQAGNLLGRLSTKEGVSAKVLAEQGTLAYWLGVLDYQKNSLDSAQKHFSDYRALATELVRREPANPDWRLELSYALNNLGSIASKRQDIAQALSLFEASVVLKASVLKMRPTDVGVAVEQADSLSWIGSALEREGRLREAAEYYQRQRVLLGDIGQRHPEMADWRHRLALADVVTANLQMALGHREIAGNLYTSAEALLTKLVAADPSNRNWQKNLCYAQTQHAYLWLLDHKPRFALDGLRHADECMRPMLIGSDVPLEWQRLGALIDLRTAQAARDRGDMALARRHLNRALKSGSTLANGASTDSNTLGLLARILITQGDFLVAANRPSSARRAWNNARATLRPIIESSLDHRILQPWIAASVRLGMDRETTGYRARLIRGGYRLSERAVP